MEAIVVSAGVRVNSRVVETLAPCPFCGTGRHVHYRSELGSLVSAPCRLGSYQLSRGPAPTLRFITTPLPHDEFPCVDLVVEEVEKESRLEKRVRTGFELLGSLDRILEQVEGRQL